ncbi:MAG: tRNA guanosine(34) transglycosylase Tgt [Symbiobacteriaceae bacterium]|nr:tRNA guanosine(34) transglycosylase Tgt [Symbiobacteriaceae bacterium]
MFTVTCQASGTAARLGTIATPRNSFPTPAFMPVGTQAAVKSLTTQELHLIGAGIILCNTYHLYLRPGVEVMAAAGGVHNFMKWDGSLLSDSGGFQVFSLSALNKISDEGVAFRSHIDGSRHLFTPERAIEVQETLGANIIMAFDECAPYPADESHLAKAVERTTRWAERCLAAQKRKDQDLFGIVQGGVSPALRRRSTQDLLSLGFPGYAIGGLSVGEPKELMYNILEEITPLLPQDKPRYLMGVGSPDALIEGVRRGIDLFDCVLPTRIARNGSAMTSIGRVNLRNAEYAKDFSPLDAACGCPVCYQYSKAYLRHLFMGKEMLGPRLISLHNLYFIMNMMQEIRQAISHNRLEEYRRDFYERYRSRGAGF